MKIIIAICCSLFASSAFAQAALPAGSNLVTQTSTRLDASQCQVASGTAQQTITITPPAGQSVYVTWISSSAWATTAPAASSVTTTTTNFNGTIAFGLTATGGVSNYAFFQPTTPAKSIVPSTAVTIVSNAAITSVTFTIMACYYFAP
jgi:hypothetical protein